MKIKIYNTLTKEKEEFTPLEKGKVKIYSCGPTVYNYPHIGNLRSYVFADILKKTFKLNNYEVNHVINITDVGHLTSDEDEGEDKLVKGAKRENKTVWDIAKFYEEAFYEDLKKLNIEPANHYPKATEHIQEMIELIKKIQTNGYVYEAEGNIYFDTEKFEEYGKLTGRKQKQEETQSRVEIDKHKKNNSDFVLWFTRHKYENHEMEWESPWGKGFPGWHIECSAMSCKYLGEKFDIHTGGIDHVPIHHTNEIAQSEAAFGHEWVTYWMHNEFLVMSEGEKMSKSKDGFLTLQVLIDKGYKPEEYRYFLLGTHYRKKIMYSKEAMDTAKNSLQKLKNKIREIKKAEKKEIQKEKYEEQLTKFKENLNDDLNTAKALATTWEMLEEDINETTKLALIEKFDEVLGLKLIEKEQKIPEDILKIQEERDATRKNKNWKKSDELRDLLKQKGYKVLDSKEGSEIIKE
ncbi:cysteine--tRNA ligase [Candidatus Woesearchaeota archaeon]|nr:cysteine--tRNA ligase [Candidatus Woesearchaeota archaeon]